DDTGSGPKITCSLCTRAVKKIQQLAGDNPDEDAVTAALRKGCRALGRALGKLCQRLVSHFQRQIRQGLQDGDTPRAICSAIRLCKA
ncbi:NKL protein, partial [Scytalopus superciliaris]|nr:NKL protein [Scytalopus superciliaris]